MRVRKNKRTNIWPAGKFCRLLASAGMLLLVSAATGRAQAKDGTDLVPVSMNAGETYVINDIKPGTKPSFNIAQNPNAFVSYDSPAGQAYDPRRRSGPLDSYGYEHFGSRS